MKVLLSFLTLTFFIFLSVTTTGSLMLYWPQTFYLRNGELSYWSSMEMEDIQIVTTSNKPEFEYKQSWAKGDISTDWWGLFDVFLNKYFSAFKNHITVISKELDLKAVATVQCWVQCPSFFDDAQDFTYKVAFDGEDALHLNLPDKVWVAESRPFAQAAQQYLQKDEQTLDNLNRHVKVLCNNLATAFSYTGGEVFSRKIQPQVFITSRSDLSEKEVFCMVTGFYPKSINVSLWKSNKMEDPMSTETLPNGDGTYQITVSTMILFTELQSVYCRVEHSSFKEPFIVYLDKKHGASIGLVVGISIAVIFCAVALASFIKMYKKYKQDNAVI